MFSWGGDPIGELSNLYSCDQWPPNGQNDPRYCNKAVDVAMGHFKASYDPAVRLPFVEFEQQQIVKDAPTVVLRVNEDLFAYNNDLKGFVPAQLGPFDDMMNVEI
jgi:ABC-type transport system substrate-binding protein